MKEIAIIKRIREMEFYFDTICNAFRTNPTSILEDSSIQDMLQKLIYYYESKQWLDDYACDEHGELPADLKRGVLSEDGVYNLLSDIQKLKKV